jgi:hypothetical protein
MNTLLRTWQQDGHSIKDGGNTVGTSESESNTFLMSKAPELWRALAQAQKQLEMASECLANGRVDEAILHTNSLWRERKDLIDNVFDKFDKIDNKIDFADPNTWSEDMINASADSVMDLELQEQVFSGKIDGWSQEMIDASLATIHDLSIRKKVFELKVFEFVDNNNF